MEMKPPSGSAGAVTRVINEAFEVMEIANTRIEEVREVEDIFKKLKLKIENLENAYDGLMDGDLSEEESEKLSLWMEEKMEVISGKKLEIRRWLNEKRELLEYAGQDGAQMHSSNVLNLLKEQSETNAILASNQRIAMLPPKELEPFNGDPFNFVPFLRAFNQVIVDRTEDDVDRLHYLEQYTRGKARDIVRSCSYMQPSDGFTRAIKLLSEKYGNEYHVAQSFSKKMREWPSLKPEDGTAMEEFATFLLGCQNYMEGLKSLSHLDNVSEIKVLVMKLPYKIRERWRIQADNLIERRNNIRFEDFVEFVIAQARILNRPIFGDIKDPPSSVQSKQTTTKKTSAYTIHQATSNAKCVFCKSESCSLRSCSTFANKPNSYKVDFIKGKGLCFGCLGHGHKSRDCLQRLKCSSCDLNHPTVLHRDSTRVDTSSSSEDSRRGCLTSHVEKAEMVLPSIPVQIRFQGRSVCVNAILDTCSTDSFVSESALQGLGIKGNRAKIAISTIERQGIEMDTKVVYGLEVADLSGRVSSTLPICYAKSTLPISEQDVLKQEDLRNWKHLEGIPFQLVDAEIGLLLGMNALDVLKPLEVVSGSDQEPFAIRHKLGWAFYGPKSRNTIPSLISRISVNRIKVETDQMIRQMFEQEFPDDADSSLAPSIDDLKWKRRVDSTLCVLEDGHWEIGLPFREEDFNLPNNRVQALQRLNSLKRRLAKSENLKDEYSKFVQNMLDQGYAERVPPKQDGEEGKIWYITHHPVFHKQKKKLRVVFNCSLSFHNQSLNDHLLPGPNLVTGLVGILLRFREGRFAMTADIEKMYYQVRIPENHRDFLRFLWFRDGDLLCEPEEFRLKVHVFGATSSPSCSNFALKETANSQREKYSHEAVKIVNHNFYVDDLLLSTETEEDAIRLATEIRDLCFSRRFNLVQFHSNSQKL